MRRLLEKELHRHIENLRDLEQAARADAVHALLVFLHLLKSEAHALAEPLLAHAEKHSAQTDPAPYVMSTGFGFLPAMRSLTSVMIG